jgi:ABC-type transport system involved in multi-copper enzyme maturation permease subunit
MMQQIRSEFRKIKTTRSAVALLVGMLALSGLAMWATVKNASPDELATALSSPEVLAAVVVAVPIFVLVLGVRSFTDEIRHGSIVPTFLATPARTRVLGAKLFVIAVTSAGFALAALGLGIGITVAFLASEGIAVPLAAGSLAALAGKVVFVAALWSALGVAIGALVRHQVAAIVGALAWVLVAESMIALVAPGAVAYLPGHAATAAVGMATDPTLLSPAMGAVVLAGWAAGAAGLAAAAITRRDVA